jgi:hypothetical protein
VNGWADWKKRLVGIECACKVNLVVPAGSLSQAASILKPASDFGVSGKSVLSAQAQVHVAPLLRGRIHGLQVKHTS